MLIGAAGAAVIGAVIFAAGLTVGVFVGGDREEHGGHYSHDSEFSHHERDGGDRGDERDSGESRDQGDRDQPDDTARGPGAYPPGPSVGQPSQTATPGAPTSGPMRP